MNIIAAAAYRLGRAKRRESAESEAKLAAAERNVEEFEKAAAHWKGSVPESIIMKVDRCTWAVVRRGGGRGDALSRCGGGGGMERCKA